MKKQTLPILISLTCIFAAFTIGFFLGRNMNHETIYLSKMPAESRITAPPATVPSETEAPEVSFPVNINTATVEELKALPGIGETLARRILAYRDSAGRFAAPEELLNVEGIGSGKLESILEFVTTGG